MTRDDSINVIRHSLEEAKTLSQDICVRLEVPYEDCRFIQVFVGWINAVYPLECSPESRGLLEVSESGTMKLLEWRKNGSAVFEYSNLDTENLANWLDRYFVDILGCNGGGYLLDVTYDDFGGSDDPGPSAETIYSIGRAGFSEDKTILIPAGGWSDSAGIWDGQITVKPSDRYYNLWHWIIQDGRWSHEDCKIKDSEMPKIEVEFLAAKDAAR